ncbi:hypothetical protein CEXT_153331 [Caerostris extrusa]|uniref:Uncharacterized protein n=1 Tax=Caerostris extrusa TaxID=172846 RepID=A0AAV4N6I6_CAEEX|nr:hypothetical protein CEXT_153331 [Caerostris extrusa]
MLREAILLITLPIISFGLKITRFEVPSLVVPGDSAILTCFYDLGKEKLYSVKVVQGPRGILQILPESHATVHGFSCTGVGH